MAGIDKATKLLLHGDGTDNGTTITDSSMFAKTISRSGNTCTKTGIKKLGTAAIYFDGSGDYITAPDHADWVFAQNDFCIDLWVNFSALPAANATVRIISQYASASVYWAISYIDVSGTKSLVFQNNGTTICTYNVTFTTGQWYHIAVSRYYTGGTRTTRLFIDGSIVNSVTTDYTVSDVAAVLNIGGTTGVYFTGYMDEVRVSHYDPRWVDTFTPPTEAYSFASTFYINPETGNENLAGTSWATAWKTIKYGASTIVPAGALVKIAKSPDPVSIGNATWTHKSATVTLASSLTQEIDNCESGWTASTNITITYDASYKKQGSYGMKVVVGSSFTTGKMAYKTLSSPLNLSTYIAISFWIKSSVAIAAFGIKICLCSDTTGNTPVDTLYVSPSGELESTNWNARRINKGSALGSSIQSIAIYVDSDPGVPTIYFDNIMACNNFSLLNLITKKDSNSDYEAWYGISSIVGTTVTLDDALFTNFTGSRGYYGTGGTVESWIRTPFIPLLADDYTVLSSGDASNYITFSGGYNTSSDEVDGETYVNGLGTQSGGFILNAKSYTKMYRVNPVGCYLGLSITGSHNEFYAHSIGNNFSSQVTISGDYNLIDIDYVINGDSGYTLVNISGQINTFYIDYLLGGGYSMTMSGTSRCNIFQFILIANASSTRYLNISGGGNKLYGGTIKDFAGGIGAIYISCEGTNYFYDIVFQNSIDYDIYYAGNAGYHRFVNCTFDLNPPINVATTYYDTNIRLIKIAGDINANKVYNIQGVIESQTSIRYAASGIAWKISPTSTTYAIDGMPLICPLTRIAVAANAQVTVSAWMRRTDAGLIGKLVCPGKQIAGVTNEVSASLTDTGGWQQLTIQFTPTEQGVVEIEAQCYGGTTYSMYVDDLTVSQG